MAARTVLALFATTFVQSAYSRGIATPLHAPCGNITPARSYGCGIGSDITAASALNAARGGSLGISTGSWVPATGMNVASENVYEGPVTVVGNLPFLGTVFLEGVFPTAGTGAVSYGCGNGAVGITAEGGSIDGISYTGLGHGGLSYPGLRYNGLGFKGLGYNGYAGRIGGCGCGIY